MAIGDAGWQRRFVGSVAGGEGDEVRDARVTGTEVAAVISTGTPIKWRMAEALAELGPSGLEKAFIKGGNLLVELARGTLRSSARLISSAR